MDNLTIETTESMKLCMTCSKSKPLSQMCKDRSRKSGYAARCKDCSNTKLAKYRLSYKQHNLPSAKKLQQEYRYLANKLIHFIKSSLPCRNCVEWFDSNMMEFDHKVLAHNEATGNKWSKIKFNPKSLILELEKVQILCSNCHALRTAQQRQCKWNLGDKS